MSLGYKTSLFLSSDLCREVRRQGGVSQSMVTREITEQAVCRCLPVWWQSDA